jgi:nitroimidazol reductase NimA-like FMN-containing flavoprotein (pyridoxamine 5'-phosphate oxidase superfamily)
LTGERGAVTESLTKEACWGLLGAAQIGRLAVTASDGVDIYPINYMVTDGLIYFRSAPGRKLVNLTSNPIVAFEVDGIAEGKRWSVVARGTATRLNTDAEIEASGVHELQTHSPTTKWNYVKITPRTITGRRFADGQAQN